MSAKQLSNPLAQVVDELGEIGGRLAPNRDDIKREKTLEKALRDAHRDATPGRAFEVVGLRYRAVLSPCGSQTIVDKPALLKRIGLKLYAKIASVTLKALESCDEIAPGTVSAVTHSEQTGPRSITVQKL